MSLPEETPSLQCVAHDLMYLGMGGSPVYSDDLSRCNGEIYHMTIVSYNFSFKSFIVEKQANVCLTLLTSYNASFIDHDERQGYIQETLNRCWDILEVFPTSLLKLCLLTACYDEIYNEPLADEAHKVIAGWTSVSLTSDHKRAIEESQNVVDNPHS